MSGLITGIIFRKITNDSLKNDNENIKDVCDEYREGMHFFSNKEKYEGCSFFKPSQTPSVKIEQSNKTR